MPLAANPQFRAVAPSAQTVSYRIRKINFAKKQFAKLIFLVRKNHFEATGEKTSFPEENTYHRMDNQ